MIDIKILRENSKLIKKVIEARNLKVDLNELFRLDEERTKILKEVEENNKKKRILAEKGSEKGEKIVSSDGKSLRYKGYELDEKLKKIEEDRKKLLDQIPNIPEPGVPEGGASNKQILSSWGEPKKFNFTPKDHLMLGETLGIIDVKTAAKVSGSRFGYLKNEAVLLEFALVQLALDILTKEGFNPIIPPALIRKEITEDLGYWNGKIDEEHTANENYYLVSDPEEHKQGLYLIGTGEHAVVPMHSNETLEEEELPKKYVAFSPSFRREAGSYGKDTKGIFRVHQFDKVEMVEFVKPEDDEKERRKMLSIVENLLQKLELPYRVVKLAAGDLSLPAAETVDIETWIPSQQQYRETHSISTTTDFQARRLNIKCKIKQPGSMTLMGVGGGERIEYVHILNGTAFAIGRTIISILENYQQKDGSVNIPKALHKYLPFTKISKSS